MVGQSRRQQTVQVEACICSAARSADRRSNLAQYYADADIEAPDLTPPEPVCAEWEHYLGLLAGHSQRDTMTPEFVREGIRHYYGMVAKLTKIGAVLTSLQKSGQLDNTWVIYSCDHGEICTGPLAKMNFYQGSAQVPLLIVPPSAVLASSMTRWSSLRMLLRPYWTTNIAGAPRLAGSRGRSLVPLAW